MISADELERRLDAEPDLREETAGLDDRYVYDTKRALLERMIAERLVDREARTHASSLAEVQREIAAEVIVNDQEVDRAYRLARDMPVSDPRVQRRVRRLLVGNDAEDRQRIREFLWREKCRVELLQRAIPLRQGAHVVIYLQAPKGTAQPRKP